MFESAGKTLRRITTDIPPKHNHVMTGHTKDHTSIPVRKVTLYKTGKAYVRHEGPALDGRVIKFHVSEDELQAITQTFTSISMTSQGHRVLSANWEGSKPLHNPFDGAIDMHSLLKSLQGARVEIVQKGKGYNGHVVCVQQKSIEPSTPQAVRLWSVVLCSEGGSFRVFGEEDIDEVKILDPSLREQLTVHTANMHTKRSSHLRTITVDPWDNRMKGNTDGSSSQIRASYLCRNEPWSMAYRIITHSAEFRPWSEPMDEKRSINSHSAPKHTEDPSLLVYARVTNNTSQDWNSISLSLVSGTPLEEKLPIGFSVPSSIPTCAPSQPAFSTTGANFGSVSLFGSRDVSAPNPDRQTPFVDEARVNDLSSGDLIELEVPSVVTVEKGSSALIPINFNAAEAQMVHLYDHQGDTTEREKGYCRTAVHVTNSTDFVFEEGSVVLLNVEDNYLGKSLMPKITQGEEAVLPFNVCREVVVKKLPVETKSQPQMVPWLIKNKTESPTKVYLDAPNPMGYILSEESKKNLRKKTDGRIGHFILPLEASTARRFTAEYTMIQSSKLDLLQIHTSPSQFLDTKLGDIQSPELRSAFGPSELKYQELLNCMKDVQHQEEEGSRLVARMNRLKDQYGILHQSGQSEIIRRVATQIVEVDDELNTATERYRGILKQRDQLASQYQETLKSINFEGKL
ncbi:hypothetical protein PROFUN_00023 [Planoprotostelium fungivorum]|uniref:DUF4139 domain-containing protein n=1 Tax=Planoprotostelium fungivorum TaxID=1890364 RepID=A0A2P6P0E7_9EUKA|nr:hypothetical protein PROFUN_00023 [Planoprotostelium fungivorum]